MQYLEIQCTKKYNNDISHLPCQLSTFAHTAEALTQCEGRNKIKDS